MNAAAPVGRPSGGSMTYSNPENNLAPLFLGVALRRGGIVKKFSRQIYLTVPDGRLSKDIPHKDSNLPR